MTTYLLTWNPSKWPWPELPDCIQEIKATGHYLERWSCGRNHKIVEGDRLFLLRQGLEPRGIVGAGRAVTIVFDDWHWDDAKRASGQRALYIDVEFEVLLDADREPILPRAQLNEGVLGQMYWDSQSSGILIPAEVAQQLEMVWMQFNQQSEIRNQK
jgi:5-methylcytosine-specific restriction enzyme A